MSKRNRSDNVDNKDYKYENTPKKRNSSRAIKSFIEYPGGDWIISAPIASSIVIDSLEVLLTKGNAKNSKIMLPGVGFSSLPIILYQAGYHHLTLLDLEEESISKQRNDFISIYGSVPSSVRIIRCDVLSDGFLGVEQHSQDIIIDKGFMDVFLRQSSSQRVWKALQDTLKPSSGIMLIFSIFHSKWKRLLSQKQYPSVHYASIEVKRYSNTRPSVSSFSYPGAFFIAQQHASELIWSLTAAEASLLQDFRSMKASDFPLDASQL